jgi:hypothetical protein
MGKLSLMMKPEKKGENIRCRGTTAAIDLPEQTERSRDKCQP